MWYLQPSPVVFKVTGKDARRYLNNRLSQDLRTVSAGASLVAGALSPQGRVEGLYTVYVQGDDLFYLVTDGGERQPLFAALGRYIVADRVSIVDCSSDAVVGHVTGSAVPDFGDDVTCLTHQQRRLGDVGEDFLIIAEKLADIRVSLNTSLGTSISKSDYDIKRFAAGFAEYPSEINDSIILTEGGLRDAVSFQKGCYVGQEVIERSDALGKLPRHLERVVFEGHDELPAQASVLGKESKPIGKIVSTIADTANNKLCAFALLKNGAYVTHEQVQCEGRVGTILSSEEKTI
jgi:folate-binding protein YgfZ